MKGSLLGPEFSDAEIEGILEAHGAIYDRLEDEALLLRIVELLRQEQVIGWVQGRMEFGPRALGNRSILGDPRSPKMQSIMNLKVKFRESFRPFAPIVLRDRVSDYFELNALLRLWDRATGCPVLVNTSFNVRGEPIVCTPDDAYRCFVNTEMDYLVIGNHLLERTAQPQKLLKRAFDLVPD